MVKGILRGKTYFYVSMPTRNYQAAIHRAPDGHFSYVWYKEGRQQGGQKRITQQEAADILQLDIPELLELFKLD